MLFLLVLLGATGAVERSRFDPTSLGANGTGINHWSEGGAGGKQVGSFATWTRGETWGDGTQRTAPAPDFVSLRATPRRSTSERCKDGYYNYRLQLVCPDRPRHPRSLQKRTEEVFDAFRNLSVWDRLPTRRHSPPAVGSVLTSQYRNDKPTVTSVSSWRLLALLQLLSLVQFMSLLLETTIVRGLGLQPRLASFAPPRSLSKSLRRLVWRIGAIRGRRLFVEVMLGWTAAFLFVGFVARAAWLGQAILGLHWDDSALRQSVSHGNGNSDFVDTRTLHHAWPVTYTARCLVLLDCLATGCFLLQPIQHLLPHSLFPPFVGLRGHLIHKLWVDVTAGGTSAQPVRRISRRSAEQPVACDGSGRNVTPLMPTVARGAPTVEVETKWLLAVLVEAMTCIAALASYALIVVSPYSSSPLDAEPTVSPHSYHRIDHLAFPSRSFLLCCASPL